MCYSPFELVDKFVWFVLFFFCVRKMGIWFCFVDAVFEKGGIVFGIILLVMKGSPKILRTCNNVGY